MIIFCGDIHGNTDKVISYIKQYDLRDCTIIQVGDFGIGFELPAKEQRRLDFLNKPLKLRNINLKVIRGNHDNKHYFLGQQEYKKSNIELLKDYSILNIDNLNILCVGGAISVDRKPCKEFNWKGRKEGVDYWKNEVFLLDEEKISSMKDIDIVATHSSPDFCTPREKSGIMHFLKSDPELLKDVDEERDNHTKMYNILKDNGCKIDSWFYGHFHFYNKEIINNTKFILLDINQFVEHK